MREDSEKKLGGLGKMSSESSRKKPTPMKVVAALQNLSNIVSLPKLGLETQSASSADESEPESESVGEVLNSVREDCEK